MSGPPAEIVGRPPRWHGKTHLSSARPCVDGFATRPTSTTDLAKLCAPLRCTGRKREICNLDEDVPDDTHNRRQPEEDPSQRATESQ